MYLACQRTLERKDTSAASKSLLHRTAHVFLPKTRQGDGRRKDGRDKGGNKMMA